MLLAWLDSLDSTQLACGCVSVSLYIWNGIEWGLGLRLTESFGAKSSINGIDWIGLDRRIVSIQRLKIFDDDTEKTRKRKQYEYE